MPDWTKSMQQTFEYYIVNPNSWMDEKPLKFVKSSTIDRDEDTDTLGSMSIDMDENIGEAWVRVYLVTIQNGVTERHPLGTFLVQTPSMETDGKTKAYTADAYTPLIILKEKLPPLGYYIEKGSNILNAAYEQTVTHIERVPVVKTSCNINLVEDKDFVADPENNWFEFISDLLANAEYRFGLDEMGRVLFLPKQELDALQPVWTFDDGNSSILYPDLTFEDDFYGIPNVIQVTCSSGGAIFTATVENRDTNSPVSIENRGREIWYRDTNPSIVGVAATQEKVNEYADKLKKELSTIERRITFKHGYCPVRIGDAVRLNYERAGIYNVKAKVVSQSIECVPGCPVSTTVVYKSKLWG